MNTRQFRVRIHTADGWIEYGRYATWRGAQRASKNATRKFDYIPLRDRVGGTDGTYLIIDEPSDNSRSVYSDLWNGTNHQGCARVPGTTSVPMLPKVPWQS